VHALYLHVPFCRYKCGYCDFYSLVDHDDRRLEFVHALLAELDAADPDHRLRPQTLFVGGGTPSRLEPETWSVWIESFRQRNLLRDCREFTVEMNPESTTFDLLTTLRRAGLTRVSLGVQSFDPEVLRTLERTHDPRHVPVAVDAVREAGVRRLNLDLIFAVPGQTLESFDHDLSRAIALEPDHLSVYNLTYEPGTALNARFARGSVDPADESTERRMYRHSRRRLAEAGFEPYEISAWARRRDEQSRHNLTYWRNGNWLGLGPGAGSHVHGRRWKNQPHLARYLRTPGEPPRSEDEILEPDLQLGETLMLGLRLREGVDLDVLEARFAPHARLGDGRRETLARYTAAGLLTRCGTRVRLTEQGLFVADAIAAELLHGH